MKGILGISSLFVAVAVLGTVDMERGTFGKLTTSHQGPWEIALFYQQSHAVVIGLDYREEYNSAWPELANAENDARAMAEFLRADGFNVTMLLGEDADLLDIRKTVVETAEKTGPQDRMLVYFAGHGHSQDGKGYLVPADAGRGIYSMLSMSQIRDWCDVIRAKHLLFVVDSCFGGLALAQGRNLDLDPQSEQYLHEVTSVIARQIITAGQAGETALDEGPRPGNGMFTGTLLDGLEKGLADLDRNGYITGSELGNYMTEKVFRDSDGRQRPAYGPLRGHEMGEFIFFAPDKKKQILKQARAEANVTTFRDGPPDAGSVLEMMEQEKRNMQGSEDADVAFRKAVAVDRVGEPEPAAVAWKGFLHRHAGSEYAEVALKRYRYWQEYARLMVIKVDFSDVEASAPAESSASETGQGKSRFQQISRNSVLDTKTGLMWATADSSRNLRWDEAEKYCSSFSTEEFEDWRMPTEEELRSLDSPDHEVPAVERVYTVRIPEPFRLSTCCIWASDVRGDKARFFDFHSGESYWYARESDALYRALPVREHAR